MPLARKASYSRPVSLILAYSAAMVWNDGAMWASPPTKTKAI